MTEPQLDSHDDTAPEAGDPGPETGDTVFVTVLGGPVPATVLAVRGDRLLVEYELGTYTGLRVVPAADPATVHYRPLSYHRLPRHWLEAIVAAGIGWIGGPRGSTASLPSPAELLAALDARRDSAGSPSTHPAQSVL